MPGDRTLRSLDASNAIPTRVLRFEVSGLHRRTPVRPVLPTGQTGTHRSDRSDPPVKLVWHCYSIVFGSSVLALWINQGEGLKRRTREGGSEWEPIKILFKNSAYEPKFTRAPPQASLAKFT
jgi:hypothetical protein